MTSDPSQQVRVLVSCLRVSPQSAELGAGTPSDQIRLEEEEALKEFPELSGSLWSEHECVSFCSKQFLFFGEVFVAPRCRVHMGSVAKGFFSASRRRWSGSQCIDSVG